MKKVHCSFYWKLFIYISNNSTVRDIYLKIIYLSMSWIDNLLIVLSVIFESQVYSRTVLFRVKNPFLLCNLKLIDKRWVISVYIWGIHLVLSWSRNNLIQSHSSPTYLFNIYIEYLRKLRFFPYYHSEYTLKITLSKRYKKC